MSMKHIEIHASTLGINKELVLKLMLSSIQKTQTLIYSTHTFNNEFDKIFRMRNAVFNFCHRAYSKILYSFNFSNNLQCSSAPTYYIRSVTNQLGSEQ